MEFNYEKVEEIIKNIFSIKELEGKIFLSGGIVPWLISNCPSNRLHGDIDIICKKDIMPLVRDILKENGIYDSKFDSLNLPQEGNPIDYGIDTFVENVPVGFYPYEVDNGQIIQRTSSYYPTRLKTKIIPDISEPDYLTYSKLNNGMIIGHSALEVIRATKLISNRDKDQYDIAKIDEIGIDEERYSRIIKSTSKMTEIKLKNSNPLEDR